MPSDRARISYDPTRQYRSVLAQQGRVTLEADWNEEVAISGETLREETLEIVGPAGTPDDGYRVQEGSIPDGPFDFQIGAGTMYVGGERIELLYPIQYAQQTEWLHHTSDPRWVDPQTLGNVDNPTELIYLYLREQDVRAVEDQPLKDVALGGPDTDSRTRLVQHIVRFPTRAQDCAGAMAEAAKQWAGWGQDFDGAGMRLLPSCRLKVNPLQTTDSSLCEPEAKGGYVGAENQLIQVRVADVRNGQPVLLWAYNNASNLYRVAVQPAGSQTLHLDQPPVDDYHNPRTGQVVEVLRAEVDLGDNNYIAAATGAMFTLTSDYDPGTQTLTLPSALPAEYLDAGQNPQLFMRLWNGQVTMDGNGTAELKDAIQTTGLSVTLQPGDAGYETGVFWQIAVRPSTPTQVYPQRYLEDFQPPDGPREWVCPLAVVTWQNEGLTMVSDCRNPFDNLVDLTRRRGGSGCCTVLVRPEDVEGGAALQAVIDKAVGGPPLTICLAPGTYTLPEPLKLDRRHAHLTLTACQGGAVLVAAEDNLDAFLQGMILLVVAGHVTISGIELDLPQVPFRGAGALLGGVAPTDNLAIFIQQLLVCIGIRSLDSDHLTVERCTFVFPSQPQGRLFGAGIYVGGNCRGHAIRSNQFVNEGGLSSADGILHALVGYLTQSSTQFATAATSTALFNQPTVGGAVRIALLDEAELRDNRFYNVAFCGAMSGEFGDIAIESNTATGCYGGFVLRSPRSSVSVSTLGSVVGTQDAVATQNLASGLASAMLDPALLRLSVLGKLYPIPEMAAQPAAGVVEMAAGDVAQHVDVTTTRLQTVMAGTVDLMRSGIQIAGQPVGSNTPAAPGANQPPPQPADTTDRPAGPIQELITSFDAGSQTALLNTAFEHLNRLDQAAVATLPADQLLNLSLRFTENELTLLPDNERSSSFGLLVTHEVTDVQGAATIGENTIRTRSGASPVVASTLVEFCTVTGNVLLNESSPGGDTVLPGLIVWSAPFGAAAPPTAGTVGRGPVPIAITGNVIRGQLTAPGRPQPAPLDTWDVLNTVFM